MQECETMLLFVIFITISVASSAVIPSNPEGFSCDFDSSFCGFTFDLSVAFNWSRSNDTPSFQTGPTGDHTFGTGEGSFAYIETSWPRIGGEKARLISTEVDTSKHNCLEFHYHMFGLHIDTLNVYLESDMENAIWSLSKEQGNEWKKARVVLTSSAQIDKVVFEGISGSSYSGDISIDDVSTFHDASCSIKPDTAGTNQPPPTTKPVPPLPPQPNCGEQAKLGFIVGGSGVNPGDYPWQAMLLYQKSDGTWKQFCGGSLIYPGWVLTAAHCVIDTDLKNEKVRVRMGAHYTDYDKTHGHEQDLDVVQIINHPSYNYFYRYDNDLALLRLNGTARENRVFVRSICLPRSGQQFAEGHSCHLSGWGKTVHGGNSSKVMHSVEVPLVSNEVCTANVSYSKDKISSNMLCAGFPQGGKDTCQGDSGGPLACSQNNVFYLMGVTSWGYGCAVPDYYGVYARVGSMLDWIAQSVTS